MRSRYRAIVICTRRCLSLLRAQCKREALYFKSQRARAAASAAAAMPRAARGCLRRCAPTYRHALCFEDGAHHTPLSLSRRRCRRRAEAPKDTVRRALAPRVRSLRLVCSMPCLPISRAARSPERAMCYARAHEKQRSASLLRRQTLIYARCNACRARR